MRFRRSLLAAVLAALVAVGVGLCRGQAAGGTETATIPACAVSTSRDYFPSYIDDTFPQLKKAMPALNGLKIDESGTAEESEKVLRETGAAIMAMLPRVPNLIAKEEVSQASLALPYMVSGDNQTNTYFNGARTSGRATVGGVPTPTQRAADSKEVWSAIDAQLNVPKNRLVFSYRIQSNPDAAPGTGLREFRMNAQNEAILAASTNAGSPRGVGHGSAWLMFEPDNLNQFRFRYLGREKLAKHETIVLAFAQIPERAVATSEISMSGNTCSYFVQGVVWIDPSIFQMIRMQTDLLAPLTEFHEKKLRSEIEFGEVKITARNLTLWMPSKVEISWEMDNQAGAELHRFSDYRLFGSTSRLLIPEQD